MDFFKNCCLFLVATLAICAPLAAQSAQPTSLTFQYSQNALEPGGQGVTITGVAGAITARISQNFDQNGNAVVGADCGTLSGVFICTSGNPVGVGLDRNTLAILATKGQNTYNGTLLVSGNSCTDCVSVPISLQIGSNGQITVTAGGAPIPASGITMTASLGATAITHISVSTASPGSVQFSVGTPSQPWLTISPASGTISAGSPADLTLTANASVSGINPPATFSIVTSLGSPTITVTLNTANGVTLNPQSLTFGYALNTQTYTGQSQSLQVSGLPAGAAFTISSNQGWLLINNSMSASGVANQTFTITVNALSLGNPPAVNSYTGQITVTVTSSGVTASCQVTLTVSGTSNTTLTFSAATPSSPAPPSQTFTFAGNSGAFLVTTSTTNNINWLSVTPTFGQLNGSTVTFTVSVDPNQVTAGTYTGQIQIVVGGTIQQTTLVTLNVGGTTSNGPIASPASLTFNVPPGGSAIQSIILNGTGTYQATAFGPGIVVSPVGGSTQPAVLSVSVNANSAGVTSGLNSGYIYITSGSVNQQVNVSFNVLGGAVIQANPASLGIIYGGDFVTNIQLFSNVDPPGLGVSFNIATPPSYVQVSSTSGTTPATLAVRIIGANLQPGFNTSSLVITAPGASDSPLNVPLTVLAPGGTQGLTLTPSSLSLSGTTGGQAVSQNVTLSGGISGSAFTAVASSTGAWLSVQPTSGVLPGTLTIAASPQNLQAGATYNGTVTISVNNGPSTILNVGLTVNPQGTVTPVLSVSSTNLTYNYRTGDPVPAPQTVQVNASGASASFSVATSATWITASPLTGSTPAGLSISVDPSKFGAGTQTGTVTVTAPGATGSPQVINVTLNVTSPPTLNVSTDNVTFTYRTDGPLPGQQTVQVTSTGDPLSFTVSIGNASWLAVTPTSSTTPATLTFTADTSRLGVGSFPATVTINSGSSSRSVNVLLIVSAPLPTITDAVNAASLQGGPIAPGEIILITGTDIGASTLTKFNLTNGILDKTLAGTRVLVGGYPAALVYTSSGAVAAIVPYAMAGKLSTFVEVEFLGQRSNIVTFQLAPSVPGVFTANSQGFPVSILNSDGTPNSADNPAARNSTITVTITGEGQTIPAGVDGKITDPNNAPVPSQTVSATVNGEPAQVVSSAAGQVAGLMLVTIQIPQDGTSGDVLVTVGTNSSQAGVTVYVK